MTRKHFKHTTAGVLATLAIVAAGSAAAGTCTADFARAAIGQDKAAALCGCATITRDAVTYLQRRGDFADLLTELEGSCSGLANMLADQPTASIGVTRSGGSGEDDGNHWSTNRTRPERASVSASVSDDETPTDEHDHGDGHEPGKGKGKGPHSGQGQGQGKGNCQGQGKGQGQGMMGKGGEGGHDDGSHETEAPV